MISPLRPALHMACHLAGGHGRYTHCVLSYAPYVLYSLHKSRYGILAEIRDPIQTVLFLLMFSKLAFPTSAKVVKVLGKRVLIDHHPDNSRIAWLPHGLVQHILFCLALAVIV
jgi:hypothetical protein